MQDKKMLVIDGNSILNRAFYGIPPLTTKDGLFTQAVYGMANMILKHTDALRPDYVATAFDMPAPTFRHKADAAYKATRKGMPPELAMQLPYAKDLCRALGFAVVECEGYEADDILGTFSRTANAQGVQVYLLTGDKDSLQLITDKTTVLLASTGSTVDYTPETFMEKYGVRPDQFVFVKALMGDSSDNIPGVPGIGEKTALRLIAGFGSLDSLYAGYETSSLSAGVKAKLAAGKDSAYRSLFLARIVTDAPVALSLDDTAWNGPRPEILNPLLDRLELFSLAERLALPAGQAASAPCEYRTARVSDVRRNEYYGVTYADGAFYFAGGEDHLCITADPTELKEIFEDTDYLLILEDSKDFWHFLDKSGVRLRACAFDVSLAAYVLDSTASDYTLDHLMRAYAPGARTDPADELFLVRQVLDARLSETGAADVYYKIEHPCAMVLAEMERAGFTVDLDGLAEYARALSERADRLAEKIYLMAGEEFNINSPKQLGHILFEKLELPAGKKTKSGYSTSAEILEKLRPFYPIVDAILEYRQVTKLNSTYAVGLSRAADQSGRVHTVFQQTVTATGRLSSTEPNLQNIPIKTELGRTLRRYFLPDAPGRVLVDADYSQIELRLLAHISGDETMIRAFREGVDIHAVTASQAFGIPPEQVTPDLRKRAKAVNFGIIYGISDFKLAQDIGVTKKQAAEYIASYMAAYPKVAAYLHTVVEQAAADGYVTTMMGRRRYIPELSSGKAMLRAFGQRVAMNSPIQGTAADVMKLAMVNVHSALEQAGIDAHLILQVHDELVIESARECAHQAAEILKGEMERVCALSVPLTAATTIGETWYENK